MGIPVTQVEEHLAGFLPAQQEEEQSEATWWLCSAGAGGEVMVGLHQDRIQFPVSWSISGTVRRLNTWFST